MVNQRSFLAELKQRHVVRAAIIYAAAVWALAQGISQLSPAFDLSTGVTFWFVIACVIGFPFWIAFAWFFKFTSSGIVREDETTVDAAALRRTGRHLDYWIIGILAVAVVLLLTNQLVLQRGKTLREFAAAPTPAAKPAGQTPVAATPSRIASMAPPLAEQPIPAKSIAVLPFENLSTSKANAYFADGMQDLILTKLADIGDLKVIARTSTQNYGSHPENLSLVGQQLGVATILEGSVQKAGNEVLINVQLIDAKTDSHIWAQSYQRTLSNIFGVEGEVAEKVATALNAKLTQAERTRVANVPTHNQSAYEAFLEGEYFAQQGLQQSSAADYRKAFDYYRKAVASDPDYALAWAQLARAQLEYVHFFGNEPGLAAQAKAALDHALTLQPRLEQAHIAQGLYLMFGKGKEGIAGASAAFAAAHALKPQDWFPIFLGGILQEDQGHRSEAIESFRNASSLNPRQLPPLIEMAFDYAQEGRYPQAMHVLKHALAVDPGSWHATAQLAGVYALMGDLDGMQSVFDAAPASVTATPFIKVLHARYLIYRRDWTAAHSALLQVDVGNPKSPRTACLLGEVAYLSNDSAQARTYYQRCADLSTKNVADEQPGYAGLALVHLGQVKQALALGQRDVTESDSGRLIDKVSALLLMARIEAHAGLAKRAAITLDRLFSTHGSANYVSVPLLKLDPTWDPIRHDPRFQALLKKYGASQATTATASTSAASVPQTH